ncbi:hypothetical protein Scep_008732 [Stephania cephalantha]|uniref:Uncharacterized protein n=1 Tax=Stephania cephalantha TaxID=152367 RepID=A0AAP0JSB8_9MAGN
MYVDQDHYCYASCEGHEENELHTLFVRTRAMAQYLKQQSPATEALKDKMELLV